MNWLFVVAHADDELLGAGATILNLIRKGHTVDVLCLTSNPKTREVEVSSKMQKMHSAIGIRKSIIGNMPAMNIATVEHYGAVKCIEDAIKDCQPDVIVTHCKNDLNPDHRKTFELVCEAYRLPQRQIGYSKPITAVYSMEIPCATGWGLEPFVPDTFVEVQLEDISSKIKYVTEYDDVIRPHPHPRSNEGIVSLAMLRGGQCGSSYAEAFETIFRKESIT